VSLHPFAMILNADIEIPFCRGAVYTTKGVSSHMDEIYLPISGINTFQYCAYRFYLVYVCGEWKENLHTVKGSLDHENVHKDLKKHRKNYTQTRQVSVKSERLNILGKIDVVEKRENLIYPVEFKKGKTADWINNKLQLCAQVICLEEQTRQEIKYGYLWFFDSYKREKIRITDELRRKTRSVIKEAYNILKNGKIPSRAPINRCDGCSMCSHCLPEETNKILEITEG